jgi:translation elongation factor EF-Ts
MRFIYFVCSFLNCRKALLQYGNDVMAAEKWLHEQAKAEGWDRATKYARCFIPSTLICFLCRLSTRRAREGLIGVLARDNIGTIIELNCETDFVARAAQFKTLLATITQFAHDDFTSKNGKMSDASKVVVNNIGLCVE